MSTPGTGEIIINLIKKEVLTEPELAEIRRACTKALTTMRKSGMIMAEATISEGDRVRINGNMAYKTLRGVIGTVKEVHASRHGSNVWVYVKIDPDSMPARRPKYYPNPDGTLSVAGHCVDPL